MKNTSVLRFLLALCAAAAAGFFSPANAQWSWSGGTIANPTNIFNNTPGSSKVGIGTAAPSQKLQVAGGNLLLDYASASGNGATTGNLFFGGLSTSNQNSMRMSFYNSAGVGFKNGYIDLRTTGGTATDGLLFRLDGGSGSTERMRIVAGTGFVGIGTIAPKQKLHVNNGAVMISGTNPSGGPMLLLSDNLSTHANGRWGIEYVPNSGLNFWQPWGNTGPSNPGNNYLLLKDDGQIGMGVAPNDCGGTGFAGIAKYRLYVKGGILTEKVKVANYCSASWADYVFAPGHKIRPLREVEAYIAENKHLPGIPSADEIEKDGLDLGDMLSMQMAQIEELTLHTIEINKRLEKLEAENAALKHAATQTTTPK